MVKSSLYCDTAGQSLEITIRIPYSSKECIKFPESCTKCPNGYMRDCGRNVPFKPEDSVQRPETCVLTQLDIRELIEAELKRLGV